MEPMGSCWDTGQVTCKGLLHSFSSFCYTVNIHGFSKAATSFSGPAVRTADE